MFYWKKRPVRKKEFNTIKNRSLRSKRNLTSVLVTSTKCADILVLRIPFLVSFPSWDILVLKYVLYFPSTDCQIDNDILNRPIMARTQIMLNR